MEELLQIIRQAVREELGKPKRTKAEFVEFAKFVTGPGTQIRVSVSETETGVLVGLAKAHGEYTEKTFGFRLTQEAAKALLGLVEKYYPELLTARKRGRGA
jgi:hypothetical protein